MLTELETGSVPEELQHTEEQKEKDSCNVELERIGQEFYYLRSKSSGSSRVTMVGK